MVKTIDQLEQELTANQAEARDASARMHLASKASDKQTWRKRLDRAEAEARLLEAHLASRRAEF